MVGQVVANVVVIVAIVVAVVAIVVVVVVIVVAVVVIVVAIVAIAVLSDYPIGPGIRSEVLDFPPIGCCGRC
jgi:hypothetical protein